MALIVDIVLVAVLALCIFLGWKKGFIHAISKFLTYILSFVLANIFWKYLSVYIGRLPFIQNLITEGVEGPAFEEGASFVNKLKTMFTFLSSDVIQNGNAENLTMIISFAIIFIAALILLKLLFRLLDAIIKKIPVVKQINGLLGAIVGFFNGSIWTWAITNLFVKAFLPTLNQINPTIFSMDIANSFIVTLCTKINPITYILQFISWISSF